MFNDMMDCSFDTMSEIIPGMMLSMGLFGLLVIILLSLTTVALIRHLFFNKRNEKREENSDVKHGF